jgi:hypothetical protein
MSRVSGPYDQQLTFNNLLAKPSTVNSLFHKGLMIGSPSSVTLSGRNPATLVCGRRCFGRCLESEGGHGSRIMAVIAGGRPARPPWWPTGLAWALAIPGGFPAVVRLDHLLRQAGRPAR